MGINLNSVNISTPGINHISGYPNIVNNDIAGYIWGTIITGGEIECIIS